MWTLAPVDLSLNMRRHAITPKEADFLLKSLPKVSAKAAQHQPLSSHADKPTAAASGPPSSKLDQIHPDLANPRRLGWEPDSGNQSLMNHMEVEPLALPSHNAWQNARITQSTDHKSSRPDNKRKYSALSDEDEKSSPVATAVDSLHPKVSAADSPISNSTASTLIACNAAHTNSTCCFAGETCAADLLCHKADGTVRRQYCTDPTWTTDQCSPLCPDWDKAGTILTICDDNSYCCGYQNNDCCNEGAGIKIDPKNGRILAKGQITSSVAAASSTSKTSTLSSTGSATAGPVTTSPTLPSPTSTPSSSGLSSGAKAGIAIGCIAGAALVAGLLFLLFRERRRSRVLKEGQGHQGENRGFMG
ncbi:MAG: hypothetical protein Q9218_007991, partial [Villophora microphyllina]